MNLAASIGFAANSRIFSEIFVDPLNRKTVSAVFRKAALACGRFPFVPRKHLQRTRCPEPNGVCSQSSNDCVGNRQAPLLRMPFHASGSSCHIAAATSAVLLRDVLAECGIHKLERVLASRDKCSDRCGCGASAV